MGTEGPKQSPMPQRQPNPVESGGNMETLFSPRLKSVAAMAGWDEESILVASIIVEDTPDREFKSKKRSDLTFKSPPSNSSRRNRRAQRKSPISISVPFINLDEQEPEEQGNQKEKTETKIIEREERKTEGDELHKENSGASCSNLVLPYMDKLKEELSCAICLEICFEPSTTSCGHSFCKKCLRSAADKCGKKCPKCRQLISNGSSCTVNTVLWNTIQLLFPQEVEARKAAGVLNSREENSAFATTQQREDLLRLLSRNASGTSRRGTSSQDHALEQTLQRRNLPEDFSRALILRRSRQTPNLVENASLAFRSQRETPSQDDDVAGGRSRSTLSQDEEDALVQSLRRRNVREDFIRAIILRRRKPALSLDRNAAVAFRLKRETASQDEDASSGRNRSTSSQDEDDALAQRMQRETLSARGTPIQDEDAALALRLQREEFMEAFRGNPEQVGSSLSLARANLRAMASRAINVRIRSRPI